MDHQPRKIDKKNIEKSGDYKVVKKKKKKPQKKLNFRPEFHTSPSPGSKFGIDD